MPNQSPPLDGPPPRKRRRPALSCFECRRRKIKCDRNFPCKQCVQSRIQTCTFSPHAATGTAFGGVRNSIPTSSTLPSINETANADSAQSEKVPDCRKQPEPSAPHTTLPDPQRVGPRLRVSPVLSGPTNEGPPHGDSNSGRKNRIPVQRERSISCSTPKQSAFANDFEAIQNATPDLQGIYLKGRLYGPSHFKSTFEQVQESSQIPSFLLTYVVCKNPRNRQQCRLERYSNAQIQQPSFRSPCPDSQMQRPGSENKSSTSQPMQFCNGPQ